MSDTFDTKKQHLGDGVYVEYTGFSDIRIFTTDGVRFTNEIFLDTVIIRHLLEWLENNSNK